MNILITGTSGLANALSQELNKSNTVTCVSRSTGHDIKNILKWAPDFYHYDVCINCAYDQWSQVDVLEQFYYAWRSDAGKQIINIGSSIVDYTRIEQDKEHEYMVYKIHKQALQSAFYKLVKLAKCDIKLINPGAIDTTMIKHLNFAKKMTSAFVAKKIVSVMKEPTFKKVDLWL
jgi:dTDP-4-dehydrorhamnose reductase